MGEVELIQQFMPLREVERDYIIDTLTHCDGNRTRASKILHISLRGLRVKLHDYVEEGIKVPPPISGSHPSEQSHHSARSSKR